MVEGEGEGEVEEGGEDKGGVGKRRHRFLCVTLTTP